MEAQSFQAYGFTIEVHAGGRRVWPPSFKRFVKHKLDIGELTVEQVMDDCNVSKSLVYKWRADVRRASPGCTVTPEHQVFSEVIVAEADAPAAPVLNSSHIELRTGSVELVLPVSFPTDDLIRVILAVGQKT